MSSLITYDIGDPEPQDVTHVHDSISDGDRNNTARQVWHGQRTILCPFSVMPLGSGLRRRRRVPARQESDAGAGIAAAAVVVRTATRSRGLGPHASRPHLSDAVDAEQRRVVSLRPQGLQVTTSRRLAVVNDDRSGRDAGEDAVGRTSTGPNWSDRCGGVHYVAHPGTNHPRRGGTGFDGALFQFRMTDGSLVESNNVWYQGHIPPEYADLLPDNAVREINDTRGELL